MSESTNEWTIKKQKMSLHILYLCVFSLQTVCQKQVRFLRNMISSSNSVLNSLWNFRECLNYPVSLSIKPLNVHCTEILSFLLQRTFLWIQEDNTLETVKHHTSKYEVYTCNTFHVVKLSPYDDKNVDE